MTLINPNKYVVPRQTPIVSNAIDELLRAAGSSQTLAHSLAGIAGSWFDERVMALEYFKSF